MHARHPQELSCLPEHVVVQQASHTPRPREVTRVPPPSLAAGRIKGADLYDDGERRAQTIWSTHGNADIVF